MTLLAQLTDLHIRENGAPAYGQVDTLGFLRAAIDHLNAFRPRLDGVLVTGDLVDFGTEAEYALIRTELDRLETDWRPIPGNHDGDAFWEVFADRMEACAPHLGHVARYGDLRVVMLDSRVAGASHGEITAARADWLRARLAESDAPTLLALHHPPFQTGIAHMDRIGLRGAQALVETLRTHPPVAILSGHIHRAITGRCAGVAALVAPSPAHAVTLSLAPQTPPGFHMEPPGVMIHRWADGALCSHVSFIGAYPGPFPFTG